MKKAIYIATCLLGLSISSCSDFLEQDNRSDVPSNEFYNTKTGFNSLLNSTYSSLRNIYGGAPWVFSAGTDLFAGGKQGVDAIGLYGSSYNSADKDVQEFYTECYKGIQLANSVIYYGESTEDSSVRLQYVDEARFLRAYFYFELVKRYGGVPLMGDDVHILGDDMEIPRNTFEQCVQYICDELDDIKDDIERNECVADLVVEKNDDDIDFNMVFYWGYLLTQTEKIVYENAKMFYES